jgi:hypothetical protein
MSLLTDAEPKVLFHQADRRLTYRWVVRRVDEDTDPATLVVSLTVRHDPSAKEFYAVLRNATETDRGISIERFGVSDPVWRRRQPVARYSRTGLRGFAAQTLAALRQADADGDELYVDLSATTPTGVADRAVGH